MGVKMENKNMCKLFTRKLFTRKLFAHKQIGFYLLFFVSMFFLKTVFTRYEIIKNNKHFSRIITNPRYNLAVAMFYNSDKALRRENPAYYNENIKLINMFKNTSFVFKYNDADLMFLSVNILDKGNAAFSDIYDIIPVPRFILFRDGQVYIDKTGKPVVLKGFATRSQLQRFIDSNFDTLIKENRDRNKEIREKKIEQNLANSYYWGGGVYPYGGYWGGYSPYWGGGYWGGGYGWGGSIGVGGTFGGCGRGGYGGGRGGCGGGRGGCGGRR